MSQPDLAAARPPCTCRERDHLEGELQKSRDLVGKLDASSERVSDERDTLLEQVATLRAELECIEASAPQIHGDGKTRERSWGASYPLDRVRKLLADTAAAAAAYRQQIERETLNTATDGRFAKIEQQAREQEREACARLAEAAHGAGAYNQAAARNRGCHPGARRGAGSSQGDAVSPTFACGMPTPFAPDWLRWQHTEYRCDHCFCCEEPQHSGSGKHLRCCKCGTYMAEKFVKAWFETLAPSPRGVVSPAPNWNGRSGRPR